MKKQIKLLFGLLLFCCTLIYAQPSDAKTYKIVAYSLDKISTVEEVPEYLTLQVPSQTIAGTDLLLENDSLLRVKVTEINKAKRGKRNGFIVTKLVAYSIPSLNNKAIDVTDKEIELKIKKYSKTDFKGIAQSAATSVISHIVGIPFLNQGVAAVKGAAKPLEGQSRIKSAGISLYESTPFSYFKKGEDLNVKAGEKLTISFKSAEPEDNNETNYEYTSVETN